MSEEVCIQETKKGRSVEFWTIDVPLFLLGLNFILYNVHGLDAMKQAIHIDLLKQIIRMAALALIAAGGIIRRVHIRKNGVLFLAASTVVVLLNGFNVFNLAFAVLFAVCIPDDVDTVIQKAFRISAILVALMLVLMLTGIAKNEVWRVRANGQACYTLGFAHSNSAAIFYYSFGCLYLLSRKKINLFQIGLTTVALIVVFVYTDSRTSLVASMVFCAMMLLYQMPKENGRHTLAKGSILLVDFLFIANLLAVLFVEQLMPMDSIVTGRFWLLKKLIEESSFRNILLGGAAREVDSFYHVILFQYGIFIYALVAIAAHKMMKRLAECRQYALSGFFVSVFVMGMAESCLIRPELLVFLVAWKLIVCSAEVTFTESDDEGEKRSLNDYNGHR